MLQETDDWLKERITQWLLKAPQSISAEKVAVEPVTLNGHLPQFQPWPARVSFSHFLEIIIVLI